MSLHRKKEILRGLAEEEKILNELAKERNFIWKGLPGKNKFISKICAAAEIINGLPLRISFDTNDTREMSLFTT